VSSTLPHAGHTYEIMTDRGTVYVEVVEVQPYRDFAGFECVQIAYRIRYKHLHTPIAHLWVRKGENVREYFEKVVTAFIQSIGLFR